MKGGELMNSGTCEIIPIYLGMVKCYLLKGCEGRSVLVDCGIPGSEPKIIQAIENAGIEKHNLQLIIITHGHSDHMGASDRLREITGAKTIIHKNDSDIIRSGKNGKLQPTCTKGKLFSRFISSETVNNFIPFEPEILLDGEMSLSEYGFEGKIIETPGHTNGSLSVLLEDGSIFVGDAIMGGMVVKGKPGFPIYADSVAKAKESIRKIIELSPKMIYVGHGGPYTLDELRNMKI